FYFKTFQLGILPAQNAGQSGMFSVPQIVAASAANNGAAIRWPNRMNKAPTVTIFNAAAANNQFRNVDLGVDCTSTAAANIDESGCSFTFVAAVGGTAGHRTGGH